MVDENRIDLGAELGNLGASDDLIADIKKAAGAEKLRLDSVEKQERKKARVESSKKLYIIVAVVAAVILIAVAAFVTNRPEASRIRSQGNRPGVIQNQGANKIPGAPVTGPITPSYNPQGAAPPPPTDGYEQPANPM